MSTAATTPPPANTQPDAELRVSSRAPRNRTSEQTRASKNAAMETAVAHLRRQDDTEDEAPKTPEPRETVESIEVVLLDGRVILFGPPPNISLTMKIALSIPEAATNATVERLARVCMSIRQIDGKPPRLIANMVDLTMMANIIGDAGIDILHHWFQKYWGEVRVADLQLTKKNLR